MTYIKNKPNFHPPDFTLQQQKWAVDRYGRAVAKNAMRYEEIEELTAQIIQNTGAELMRLAEGERKVLSSSRKGSLMANLHRKQNFTIDTIKKHITSVTGVKK